MLPTTATAMNLDRLGHPVHEMWRHLLVGMQTAIFVQTAQEMRKIAAE